LIKTGQDRINIIIYPALNIYIIEIIPIKDERTAQISPMILITSPVFFPVSFFSLLPRTMPIMDTA
jgi:hypothetical protein